MRTSYIIEQIDRDFAGIYRNASKFVGSGDLWDFCIDTISNPMLLSNIVFANDMGIPPVKSLITIYERKMQPTQDFTAVQGQYMGALMGFVFKFVLCYAEQKERCIVNQLGVKTATKFLNGPHWEFEK